MELKVSSSKSGGLSPDCISDPEEKEFSDDDDDDRNHKHRRRDARSQSLERDAMDQGLSRPYRKRNKPFENGHPFRESDSQSSESWKNYNTGPPEKDFSSRFDKRRSTFSHLPFDLNQRFRVNQSFPGDLGSGRGRGRDSGSWNQRDSRFGSVDASSKPFHQGSIPPTLFSGRGLPNVSSAQSASWNTFGLIPGMPNGGLDTFHSLGLQGTLRPSINPSLNMGIPRQRCRDFEERGFCLRGDMCPMEHGVNRIVVEDVQSLSQFNLPVSLPNAHLLGTPAGPGPLPSVTAPSSTPMSSKGSHSKTSKHGMSENNLGLNGAFSGSSGAGGADVYDPDQPLWNNDCPETSTALLALHSPKNDETESFLDHPSDRLHVSVGDTVGTAVGSQSTSVSVWGRIGSSKSRSEVKKKTESTLISSEDQEALGNVQGTPRQGQGKRMIMEDAGTRNTRKPSQKALRTLFVNGIPQKNNRKEALFSHFHKFGEIIDIYIPLNSERAFVQFSKREEAEAALKSPDAVMGNRFIKLWWANRDNIPDDGMSSGNSASVTPRSVTASPVPLHLSAANRGNDNLQSSASKTSIAHISDTSVPAYDYPKHIVGNGGTKPSPPSQKKLENLELLKEELRKKQEMLDQKRNEFRRQLDKLQKHTTGVKGEVATEQAAKRPKMGMTTDVATAVTPRSADSSSLMDSPTVEKMADKSKLVDDVTPHSSKAISVMGPLEPASLKLPTRPLVYAGSPSPVNKFKLDNRPTTFRVVPPLPTGFANVTILKEHFSLYGDNSTVDLEDLETDDGGNGTEVSRSCSARITFTDRRSAEKAFANGKCWQGHNLQFMWLTSTNSSKDHGVKENSPSTPKNSDHHHPVGNLEVSVSKEAVASTNGDLEKSKTKESYGDFLPLTTDEMSTDQQSSKGDDS